MTVVMFTSTTILKEILASKEPLRHFSTATLMQFQLPPVGQDPVLSGVIESDELK